MTALRALKKAVWARFPATAAAIWRWKTNFRSRSAGAIPVAEPISTPAIRIVASSNVGASELGSFLARQTEKSGGSGEEFAAASYCYFADGDFSRLPPVHLESLLMAAVAEDLDVAVGGATSPFEGAAPSGPISPFGGESAVSRCLFRFPGRESATGAPFLGRMVYHVGSGRRRVSASQESAGDESSSYGSIAFPGFEARGPYLTPEGLASPQLPGSHSRRPVHRMLSALPAVDGPRTALFLLPFLAVGGAERLLFELLRGLRDRYRLLVVTFRPHSAALGQTIDECRSLTDHVYTLGDWLPVESMMDALRHLLRRYRVETLFSWNGTTEFYENSLRLKAEFPALRLVNQVFNHRGGWIEHHSPAFVGAIDSHVAISEKIRRALVGDWRVRPDRISQIPHAVRVPEPLSETDRASSRSALRAELDLPTDAVVVGTFIRLHEQKRPLDVVRVARSFRGRNVFFLLVGGGPMEEEVDREVSSDPPENLRRLGLRSDTDPLFDVVDLCLLTSEFEGLPVFLLEGLARGIPCVATDVGDIRSLLSEGGGVLVERVGDVRALHAGVEALLEPERRKSEGALGRKTVASRFSPEDFVRRYETVTFPVRR